MKDPAFLFYASDFLGGVSDLTMEERGQYITMLCLQQQKGVISQKTLGLSVGSVSADVLAKFERDENGDYYNVRLRLELEKRAKFIEKQRDNGKRGGRPKNPNETQTEPKNNPTQNPNKSLLENENRDENINEKDRGGTGGKEKPADTYRDTFDTFRRSYEGKKRGLDTELAVLQKHKDWRESVTILSSALNEQKRWREEARQHGAFVPNWPDLRTWLHQRRWEEELNFEFEKATNNAAVVNDWLSEDKLLAAGWRMIDIQNQFEYHPTTGLWRKKRS